MSPSSRGRQESGSGRRAAPHPGSPRNRGGGVRISWGGKAPPTSREEGGFWKGGPAPSCRRREMHCEPLPPLTAEHEDLRRRVRKVADEVIGPDAARVDREGEFPHRAHRALADAGVYATHVPVKYGGVGADALSSCLVVE